MDLTFERVIIWIVLGLFICYKRNWYQDYTNSGTPEYTICCIATIFAPLNFCIVFLRLFFINKWNLDKD